MKSILYVSLLVGSVWMVSSCTNQSFLDETQTTDLNYDVVFSDSTYTVGFLTEIYREIGFESAPNRFSGMFTTHAGLQCASDEAEFRVSSNITTDVLFATGTVNPVTVADDAWWKPYENIRRVNIFLKSVDKSPISTQKRKVYKAEARFLRAWYYAILLKHYGGIPLIGDTVYVEKDKINATRNTYKECVDYIVTECDLAAADLPTRNAGRDQGRGDAGACMALKARVLLYAASPFFNGNDFAPTDFPQELVGYPTYDKERWKLAMDAASAVISTSAYSLYIDNADEAGRAFYRQFCAADWPTVAYSGTIFEKKEPDGNSRERLFQPPSRNGGGGGYPYQGLIEEFPMKNGKGIFEVNSGYDENNPYENRDPRFNNSITHDQSTLNISPGNSSKVNIYLKEDGTAFDQDAIYSGTPTGYYINKMQHREASGGSWIGPPAARPILRYAEILLSYAEARNEYDGPSGEIYQILKSIRECAGIDAGTDEMYGLNPAMDQKEMREAIQLERRIELAFESHRFWDVRRWMIFETTDNKMMKGMEIRLNGSTKKYKEINVRQHIFRKAMYFWPIPYSETAKSTELIQNPYYN